jgi:hypothetical protein
MNAFAMLSPAEALFLAQLRSQELTAAANAHRAVSRAREGRVSRIASAVASIRRVFGPAPASRETTVVPRLADYPYRG